MPAGRGCLNGQTGRYRIGTTSLYLIDPSRPGAWVPTQRAQVVIQLWYPADAVDGYPRAPWMPPIAARLGEDNGPPQPQPSVVVTIDHIDDADVVELPDGSVKFRAVPAPTADKDTPATTKEIVSRVADVRFVLDQLAVINRGGHPAPAARSCCSGGRTWTPSKRALGRRSGRPIAAPGSS